MRAFFIIIFLFITYSLPCHALDTNKLLSDEFGVDHVIQSIPVDLQDIFVGYDFISGTGLEHVFEKAKIHVVDKLCIEIQSAWKPALQTLMIVIICGMTSPFFNNQRFPIIVVGTTAILFTCLGESKSCFGSCVDAIEKMYDFSTVLLPCLAAASVAAGATISAGVKYTAAALFMNMLLNFSRSFLIPLICSFLVCDVGENLFHQSILKALSKFLKWICITVISGAVVIFTTYISVAGIITGTGEVLATRIAKTTLSNGLPIVGKIVSDAASTLVAGAAIIRNGVGLLGMVVVLLMLLVPMLSLGLRYLLFRIVAECSELYPDDRFKGIIRGISDTYGMLFAVVGTGFITMFLTLLSFMQIVSGG